MVSGTKGAVMILGNHLLLIPTGYLLPQKEMLETISLVTIVADLTVLLAVPFVPLHMVVVFFVLFGKADIGGAVLNTTVLSHLLEAYIVVLAQNYSGSDLTSITD